MTSNWADERREAARVHEERLTERKSGQTRAARELIEAFLHRVSAARIAPEPLVAKDYSGRGPYRTTARGWYVRANRSAAIGVDGQFYVLVVAGGMLARLRPSELTPSDPPIVLGAGGRDGESIDLRDALAKVAPEV